MFLFLFLCTKLNSENNMLKIKPTVIEKISTLTAFGRIFSINLAHVIFFIFCRFTKSETKKKYIIQATCFNGCTYCFSYICPSLTTANILCINLFFTLFNTNQLFLPSLLLR